MHDEKTLRELKEELTKLLAQDPISFQQVIRVTGEIAKCEPGVVRFTTDAAMVRRLGRELVAKKETALAELVKNSYDADATSCDVIIQDDVHGGTMHIIDDGSGMSRSDIENGFMRLASDSKVQRPVSTKYHRPRAGKKGIGRFATERLGARLQVITQVAEEDFAWTIAIDWDSFVQGQDLSLVANAILQISQGASPRNANHNWRFKRHLERRGIEEGISISFQSASTPISGCRCHARGRRPRLCSPHFSQPPRS